MLYGEGSTDVNGFYDVVIDSGAINRHVDIYYDKGSCSRSEEGLLIPFADYTTRDLYTYMTISGNDDSDTSIIDISVYNYPTGEAVNNLTVSIENAYTTEIIATAVTNEEGIVSIEVPIMTGAECNVYANIGMIREDVYPGNELGVHLVKNVRFPVSIYVAVI